jgi:hypothetical protein
MRIIMRDRGSGGWQVLGSLDFAQELELQELLCDSPELIPLDQIAPGTPAPVVALAEVGLPGAGNSDILAFSVDGCISVVECKLAKNPEIRRKVIGQILEYAASLWQMSYEDLDLRVQRHFGHPLADLMAQVVSPDEWDEELFRQAVSENLKSGRFILIIAVDEINEHLGQILRYLNECSEAAFSLCAMEIKLFSAGDIEILMPRLYGPSVGVKPGKSASGSRVLLREVEQLWPGSREWPDVNLSRTYLQFRKDEEDSKIHFEVLAHKAQVLIALDLETPDPKTNRAIADAILNHRSEIERELGEPLEVNSRSAKMARLFVKRSYDSDSGHDAQAVVDDMTKFIAVMGPYLQQARAVVNGA